jgi:acetyl-CoA synthetase
MAVAVWFPDPAQVAASNLTAFLKFADCPSFDELVRAADADPGWFWDAVIRYGDLRFYRPYDRILDDGAGIERVKWCVGGVTNLVLNCIDRHRGTDRYDKPYLTCETEDGPTRTVTFAEFDRDICRFASVLRGLGIKPGDVVALFMPQLVETYEAYFGIIKIGATVLPLFSGYGAGAVAERLQLAEAKALVTVDGARRRGAVVPMKAVAVKACRHVPSVRHLVVVDNVGRSGISGGGPTEVRWNDALADGDPSEPTQPVNADEIAVIHFTSGTTGRPKGALYTHIGFVTKMVLDYGIIGDFKPSDTYLCIADMGWMVGSQLAVIPSVLGGRAVVAEGVGDHPTPDRLWRLVDDHAATWLMVTPSFIRMQMQQPNDVVAARSMRSLRVVFGSGEAWMEPEWRWLFDRVCRRAIPILNGTGGTEVSGCILLSNLHRPIGVSSFNGPVPGMGADVVRSDGSSAPVGEIGELALRRASIGLTPGLWGDDEERYLETYWSKVPGVWIQGDLATRDDEGNFYMLGRSDDTMKIAGKRVGPAEIEGVALTTGLLKEAAAVAVPDPVKGSALVLVAVRTAGPFEGDVGATVTSRIVEVMGPAYRPRDVVLVDDLPKTRTMKITRRVIRLALIGEEVGDMSGLVNPESVHAVRRAAESRLEGGSSRPNKRLLNRE